MSVQFLNRFQLGFINPLILIAVTLVAVGGGYVYFNNLNTAQNIPETANNVPTQIIKIGNGPLKAPDSFLTYLAHKKGFDKKRGIELQSITSNDPGDIQRKFLAGDFDITWGPTLVAAKYFIDGKNVKIIGPKINSFIIYLAKPNSPYENFSDLKGTRLGMVSKVSSSYQLSLLALKGQNIDLDKDYKIVFADFPSLNKFLLNGDIEFYPDTIDSALKNLSAKKAKEVGSLEGLWNNSHPANPLVFIVMMTRQNWIDTHPGMAEKTTQAYLETVEYIKNNPQIWQEEKEYLGITTPEELENFKTRYHDIIKSITWNNQAKDDIKYLFAQSEQQKLITKFDYQAIFDTTQIAKK